jgi:hypothetical protein
MITVEAAQRDVRSIVVLVVGGVHLPPDPAPRPNWFYPAFMLVVGTHYLPFMFLYGMSMFGVLAGVLVAGAVLIGLYASATFALAGWVTGGVLLVFAFIGRALAGETRHAGDAAAEAR